MKNMGETLMKIESNQYERLPNHLKSLFVKCKNTGKEEVVSLFPDSLGAGGSLPRVKITGYGDGIGTGKSEYLRGDRIPFDSGKGSAARFFYCAKASKKDRGEYNNHPTVKPTELMKYLCRLITPEDGIIIDTNGEFSQADGTGNSALDIAIAAYNLGASKITRYCKTSNPKINRPCSLAGKTIKEQDGSIELAMNRKNQQQLRDSGTSITVTNQYVQNYIPNFKTERWDGVEITSHGYISEVAKRIKDYTCIT